MPYFTHRETHCTSNASELTRDVLGCSILGERNVIRSLRSSSLTGPSECQRFVQLKKNSFKRSHVRQFPHINSAAFGTAHCRCGGTMICGRTIVRFSLDHRGRARAKDLHGHARSAGEEEDKKKRRNKGGPLYNVQRASHLVQRTNRVNEN